MKIAIDTNILVNAFKRDGSFDHLAIVAWLLHIPTVYICVDQKDVIIGEYRKNLSGVEAYEKWMKEVSVYMWFCNGNLSNAHKVFLCSKQCHEPVDHTLIAVALNSDKILFTEDSDMGKGVKGRVPPHTETLHYLVHTLGVQVYDAVEAKDLLLSVR